MVHTLYSFPRLLHKARIAVSLLAIFDLSFLLVVAFFKKVVDLVVIPVVDITTQIQCL